ncbi:MAG: hypothetical protein U5L45_07005 [Saprospiraceae bacterium]|nr:hypothetical protein [Saprospiraceae bacterium]
MKKTKTITLALLGATFLANPSIAQNAAQRPNSTHFDNERNDSIVQTDSVQRRSQRQTSGGGSNGTRIYPSRTTIVIPRTKTKTTRPYTIKPSPNKTASSTTVSKSSSSSVNSVTRGGFGQRTGSGGSVSASS